VSDTTLARVERVCAELVTNGHPITFTAVAEHARIGRATLYRDPQLRAIVDEHRQRLGLRSLRTGAQVSIPRADLLGHFLQG